jgi:S1-C subfamily serine protease
LSSISACKNSCIRSRTSDIFLEKRLAGCNAFIAESKESSPDVARAYHNRGDAYYSKGDYDRAAADDERATRLKFVESYVVRDADGKILPSPPSPEPPTAETVTPEPPKAETVIATLEPPKTETVVATGTGFVINDRGDVVTNNHVVDGCSQLKFRLNGQGLVQGRLVASDTTNDLAVANFALPRTKVASFSDTAKSRPGDDGGIWLSPTGPPLKFRKSDARLSDGDGWRAR